VGTRSYSVRIGASGTGTVTIRTGSRETWIISQVSIELASAPSGATADLRFNDRLVTLLIAPGDAASGDPPVTLMPTDTLTVNWAGCTEGTIGQVLIFYEPAPVGVRR
jgi:hypothetical protein